MRSSKLTCLDLSILSLKNINVKEVCNLKKSTFTNWADLKQVNDSEGQSEGTGAAVSYTHLTLPTKVIV